jgi:hypothetical protein
MVLVITVLSVFFNGPVLKKNQSAQASSIPASTQIGTLAITESAANAITSPVTSDMDDEGNQIYVWSFTDSTSGEVCHGVRYQRFQMSGLPLTAKTNVASNCSPGSNNHQYLNPGVAMDRTGDFVVVWTDASSTAPVDVKVQAFNSDNSTVGAPVTSEDSNSTLGNDAGAKIALNKNDEVASMHFGVTWLGCGSTPTCGGEIRNEIRAQIYTVDFTDTQNPARVNSENLILNSSPYEVTDETPVIAFSNANFMAIWPGYTPTNTDSNWAIFGRTIGLDGSLSTDVSRLSAFDSREHNPSLAGIARPSHTADTSDIFYLSFSTSYLSGNNDIYLGKIVCSGTPLVCSRTSRANGLPIFVRVNTSTSGQENFSTIRAFSNNNYSDKIYGQEESSSDYLNVTWCSYDSDANTSKVYTQNFKNDLARAETEITVDTQIGVNCPSTPSVAMDVDGMYAISSINATDDQITSKIYQSLYLRVGAEMLIHAPDSSTTQNNPRTALNSNGNHVVAYESTNSNGFKDIIYVLHDKDGNAIQNSSVANGLTAGDHTDEDVAFFTDDSSSPDYGKFIITWHYDNNVDAEGVYYQLFNADGSKLGGETVVTTDQSDYPKVSAGKFKEFLIAYLDETGAGNTNNIQYLYQNDGNAITGTATNVNSALIAAPFVTLSPNTDGTTGIGGNSKFVIAWNLEGNHYYKEGLLASADSVSLNAAQYGVGNVYDVSSAIVPDLGNLSPPKNSFMYAFVTIHGGHTQLHPYSYGDGLLLGSVMDLGTQMGNPRIAIDKGTGNLLIAWEGFNSFTSELNRSQILMFTKDSHTVFNQGDHITGGTSGAEADIADGDFQNNYYYRLTNATGPFTLGEALYVNSELPIAGYFTPDVIGVTKAQFFRLNLSTPGDDSTWITKFGPEFSQNTHFNYGQYLAAPDIDFDSRSSEDSGKLAVFTNTISSDETYIDDNGVIHQIMTDPFSVGQKEDLSSIVDQQIAPGGKYIVVPQLIDFGSIAHGTTSTVNFSDLTMPDASAGRLQVADLDGTDFDLTVSLSTLTNVAEPSETIPNSSFVIENNDGINTSGTNPGVTTSYAFTNVDDVTLDPSTNPGENANLSTTQTLLRKDNDNTGVWDIYPTVKLSIADTVNGTYTGTITFTLI